MQNVWNVAGLSAWLNYVIKKDGVNLGFNIFIKNYVMRYKPSLFIYLAYLYIYVFNANVTFNMYSIPFMHIVQFVIVLCTSHSCCPHTFAILSFFGQQFPFHNRIFAFLGGGVFALSHASMSFCTVCMKKAGIKL